MVKKWVKICLILLTVQVIVGQEESSHNEVEIVQTSGNVIDASGQLQQKEATTAELYRLFLKKIVSKNTTLKESFNNVSDPLIQSCVIHYFHANFLENYTASSNGILSDQNHREIFEKCLGISPSRILEVKVRVLTEFLAQFLAIIPESSTKMVKVIKEKAKFFGVGLKRLTRKLKIDENVDLLMPKESELTLLKFADLIQDASLEIVRKLDESDLGVVAEYLTILQDQKVSLTEACSGHAFELWSMHSFGLTDTLTSYIEESDLDEIGILVRNVKEILKRIDAEKLDRKFEFIINGLRNSTKLLIRNKFEFNNFMHWANMKIVHLAWITFYDFQFPQVLRDVHLQHVEVVQDVFTSVKTKRILQAILLNPEEICLEIEEIADRIQDAIYQTVVHEKFTKFDHLVRSFNQVVRVAKTKILKAGRQVVLEDLQGSFGGSEGFKVKFGGAIGEAARIMLKLCKKHKTEGEFLEICADFLFGLRNIDDQIRYQFILTTEIIDLETYLIQMKALAGRTTTFLELTHSKPELKAVLLYESHFLSLFLQEYASSFAIYPEKSGELAELSKTIVGVGEDDDVAKIAEVLGAQAAKFVQILGRILKEKRPALSDSDEEFRYAVGWFGMINNRLQNVLDDEYYGALKTSQISSRCVGLSNEIAEILPKISDKIGLLVEVQRFARIGGANAAQAAKNLTIDNFSVGKLVQILRILETLEASRSDLISYSKALERLRLGVIKLQAAKIFLPDLAADSCEFIKDLGRMNANLSLPLAANLTFLPKFEQRQLDVKTEISLNLLGILGDFRRSEVKKGAPIFENLKEIVRAIRGVQLQVGAAICEGL